MSNHFEGVKTGTFINPDESVPSMSEDISSLMARICTSESLEDASKKADTLVEQLARLNGGASASLQWAYREALAGSIWSALHTMGQVRSEGVSIDTPLSEILSTQSLPRIEFIVNNHGITDGHSS